MTRSASREGRERHLLRLFYDDRQRCDDVAGWVREGLEAGEKVLCAAAPDDVALLASLRSAGVDVTAATDEGRLSLLPLAGLDRATGSSGLVTAALDEGWPAVRISARAGVLSHDGGHARLEQHVDELCARLPVSAMCQYDARRTVGAALERVVLTHPDAVQDEAMRLVHVGDRWCLSGEVDASSAALLASSLSHACASIRSDSLSVDLTGLGFIDVQGCRALMLGTQRYRGHGGTLFLEAAQPSVRATMSLLGLERQQHVFLV